MKRYISAALAMILLGGMLMAGLFGCGGKKYRVEYDGAFSGGKNSYRAGEMVTVYYEFIATDTDYSFFLDGERINTDYSEDKGFIISFIMPEHDVKLVCESRNSMIYVPEIAEGTLLVDYFRETVATVGGDRYTEMTLSFVDRDRAKLDVYEKNAPDDEETRKTYLVPYEAVERCFDIMYREDLASWSSRDDLSGITGARYVLSFYLEYSGDHLRVTSEEMPPDGRRVFDEVAAVMSEYAKDEYAEK